MNRCYLKTSCFAAALALIFAVGRPAQAAPISFDPDGPFGPNGSYIVNTFDLLPGNSLAVGGTLAGPFVPVTNLFQAALGSLLASGGGVITTPGLNGAPGAPPFELTAVAGFREFAVVVTPIDLFPTNGIPEAAVAGGFTFAGGGPNFVELWFDPTPDHSDLAGTGFNDNAGAGTGDSILILSAVVTSLTGSFNSNFLPPFIAAPPYPNLDSNGLVDSYPGIDSVTGGGGINLTALVTFADPSFFTLPPALSVNLSFINSSNVVPFSQVDPSHRFVTGAGGVAPVVLGPTAGAPGTVNGLPFPGPTFYPDFQFQSDANATFTVIPEPSTMVLVGLGMGGLGLARVIRRGRRAGA